MAGGLSESTGAKIAAAADAAYALRDDIVEMLNALQDAIVASDREALARVARSVLRSSLRTRAGELVIATRLVEIATRPPVALVVDNTPATDEVDAAGDAAPVGGPGSGLSPPPAPIAKPVPIPRRERVRTPAPLVSTARM